MLAGKTFEFNSIIDFSTLGGTAITASDTNHTFILEDGIRVKYDKIEIDPVNAVIKFYSGYFVASTYWTARNVTVYSNGQWIDERYKTIRFISEPTTYVPDESGFKECLLKIARYVEPPKYIVSRNDLLSIADVIRSKDPKVKWTSETMPIDAGTTYLLKLTYVSDNSYGFGEVAWTEETIDHVFSINAVNLDITYGEHNVSQSITTGNSTATIQFSIDKKSPSVQVTGVKLFKGTELIKDFTDAFAYKFPDGFVTNINGFYRVATKRDTFYLTAGTYTKGSLLVEKTVATSSLGKIVYVSVVSPLSMKDNVYHTVTVAKGLSGSKFALYAEEDFTLSSNVNGIVDIYLMDV